MLRPPNIPRNSLLQQILRQSRIRHKSILLPRLILISQTLHQRIILLLQLLRITILHLPNSILQILRSPRRLPQRIFRDIGAEGFDTDVIDVVGFVEDDDAVFGEFFGDAFGDFGVEEVVVTVDYYVAEGHLFHLLAAFCFDVGG